MKKAFKFNAPLSVLIPAYNEESNIARVIKETNTEAKKITKDFEIVVVNDGSKDNTAEVLNNLKKKNKHLRVVHHKVNQGLGAALKTGTKECRKEYIIYIEGDGQSPLKDQYRLLQAIKDADVVTGVRSARVDYSLFRKVLSQGYLILFWLLFNLRFKDVNWSQAYRRKIFDKIKMKTNTPFFATEVVVKASRMGYRVTEASTIYHPRGGGKTSLGNLKTAWRMFKEMMKLRFGYLD